jgi:hypothetical protein
MYRVHYVNPRLDVPLTLVCASTTHNEEFQHLIVDAPCAAWWTSVVVMLSLIQSDFCNFNSTLSKRQCLELWLYVIPALAKASYVVNCSMPLQARAITSGVHDDSSEVDVRLAGQLPHVLEWRVSRTLHRTVVVESHHSESRDLLPIA